MDGGANSLTAGFPDADYETWRGLVDKTLAGAAFESRLVTETYDGLKIQPLYTADRSAGGALQARTRLDGDRPWDVRASVDHPDPAAANAQALADLEGGASSLLVRIDPTGQNGVCIGGPDDLAATLQGVYFDLAPVALEAGFLGPQAAVWLHDLAAAATLKPHLNLHLDPLTAYAVAGSAPEPMALHLAEAARTAVSLTADSAFLASGAAVHESGGSDALEIGFMAAAGVAYLKAMTQAGASIQEALGRVVLGLRVDGEYFASIAKIRAARRVWTRIAKAMSADAAPVRIEARSSRRMLSALDPWVNMIRLTAAGFAAAVGGAEAILLDPFTQPVGLATAFARRQARNIQLVLMMEAGLGVVDDPAGGAWFLETFTADLAGAAWRAFQDIEGCGGALRALDAGLVADRTTETRAHRQSDVAVRRKGLVGVTEFPTLAPAPVEVEPVDRSRFARPSPFNPVPGAAPSSGDVCPALEPWRASEAFEQLRRRASALSSPPTAFLAVLGPPKDHAPRAGFIRNLLAAGGMDALAAPPSDYGSDRGPLAVICGSDAAYEAEGEAALDALKALGAAEVCWAGRRTPLTERLQAKGLGACLYAGMDAAAALETLLSRFEAKAQAQ